MSLRSYLNHGTGTKKEEEAPEQEPSVAGMFGMAVRHGAKQRALEYVAKHGQAIGSAVVDSLHTYLTEGATNPQVPLITDGDRQKVRAVRERAGIVSTAVRGAVSAVWRDFQNRRRANADVIEVKPK